MGTGVQWTKCWLLLTIISNIYSTGDVVQNGTDVEFDGLGHGDNSTEIEENNFINLTVRFKDQKILLIKLSHQQNNLSLDLCKFVLNTTCEVSDSSNSSSRCQCLNNHTAQFLKKASSSDSGLYTWKWRDGKTLEKYRDISIYVKEGNRSPDTASAATTALIVCVLLTVVVTVTAGPMFWMRNKAKCSIEARDCSRYYRSRRSDHAVDIQVNSQTFSNGVNPHSAVVIEPTANHSLDPNYTDVIDAIHHDDPNYDNIKEQDKSQPLESSYFNLEILFYEDSFYFNNINMENRSNDSPNSNVKQQGRGQSTDPTKPSVNSKDASQPLDPYYSDIKEPSMNDDYDNNHTNDTEHDESHNYDPNYTDVHEHEASHPPDPDYSDVNQHSTHSYDPNYAEVKLDENSKVDDPNYAHVKKRIMRPPDHSTDAQVKLGDTTQPDNLFYDEVKKQEAGLAVDTMYSQVTKQETEHESVYSPKDKQKSVSPHDSTYVQGKEDTTELGGFIYNHLHEIHQHDDPNYDHIETKETAS